MMLMFGPLPRVLHYVRTPNPRRANVEEANDGLVWHKTLASTFYTYARILVDKKLEFEIFCTRPQADTFKAFYSATQGYPVKLLDHNGRAYQGYILSPEIDYAESRVRQVKGGCTDLPHAGEIRFDFFGRRIN